MKKRLLSMLLLVAMVVTALPLVALPVGAAASTESQEKTFSAEEYDKLYVKNGLLFSADFFKLNEWWNTDNIEYPLPLGPSNNPEYTYEGKVYNFRDNEADRACYRVFKKTVSGVNADGSVKSWSYSYVDADKGEYATADEVKAAITAAGLTDYVQNSGANTKGDYYYEPAYLPTAAFNKATEEWEKADKEYFKQFRTFVVKGSSDSEPNYLNLGSYVYSYNYAYNPVSTPLNVKYTYSVVTPGNGYVSIRSDAHSSGGLLLNNTGYYPRAELTQQAIFAAGSNLKSVFTIMQNVRPNIGVSDGRAWVSGFVAGQGFTASSFVRPEGNPTFANSATEVVDFTMSIIEAGATDSVIGRTEDGLLFTAEGTLAATSNFTDYFGWSNSASDMRIYAVRQYEKTLSDAEVAQNHFADLAKFFRIDISIYDRLSDESLAALYEAAIPYSMDNDRATVKAALEEKMAELLFAELTEKYAGKLDEDIVAVGAEYLLDLDLLVGIPRGALPMTYAFLLSGYKTSDDVAADYAAALSYDYLTYANASPMAYDDYNALYVKTNLKYATDFFATNAYWNNTSVTYTQATSAAYTKATNDAVWHKVANAVGFGAIGSGKSAVIGNGYVDFSAMGDFALSNFPNVVNYTNASFEFVAQAIPVSGKTEVGVMFSNIRTYFSLTTDALTSIQIQGSDFHLVKNPTYGEGKPTSQLAKRPVTFAFAYRFDTPTLTQAWNSTAYHKGDADVDGGKVRLATYVTVEGVDEPVLSVSSRSITSGSGNQMFYWPGTPTKVTAQYIDGVKQETAAEYMVIYENSRYLDGEVALYENGKTIYTNNELKFLNNTRAYDAAYMHWSSLNNRVYALRCYDGMLTADESAQNHFADVAKFFRLNISGFAALSDEQKKTVYDVAAEINFDDTREEAQAAILAALAPLAKASYEALKEEGATAWNAFLDLAADYSLDLSDILAATRDMSTVYTTVTLEALAGKGTAEAQEILDEAVFDAHHYLSFCVDPEKEGAEAWNSQLVNCAAICDSTRYVDLEKLMQLPWTDRSRVTVPFTSYEAAQEYVDTFVAETLEKYNAAVVNDYDYDSLYVKEGLLFALDFFKTNSYWNTDNTVYTVPVGPSENTAYEYDGKVYDLTKAENRYGWGVALKGATDAKNTWADDVVYTTEAAAQAAINAMAEDVRGNYKVVERATPAFLAAFDEWKSADRAFLKSFMLTENSPATFFSYLPSFGANCVAVYNVASKNTAASFSVFTMGDGYIQMRTDYHTSGGLQFTMSNPAAHMSDNLSLQVVSAYSGMAQASAATLMILNNIRPQFTSDTNNLTVTSIAKDNFTQAQISAKPLPNSYETANSLTLTLEGYMDEDTEDTIKIRTQNGTYVTATGALAYNNNALGNHYIGYGLQPKAQRVYAVRYYNAELTDAEILQNHFADIAKFYRLDLSLFDQLSEEKIREVYAKFAEFDVALENRGELQLALNAITASVYEGVTLVENAEDNARMIAIASAGALKLDRIAGMDAAGKAMIVDKFLDEFEGCYQFNGAIVSAMYDSLTSTLGAMTFAGYQVRIDTGVPSLNYAGVRAVFDIDETIVESLLEENDEVLLRVMIDAGTNQEASYINIHYTADGRTATLTTGDKTADAILYERTVGSATVTSVNYTVVYKGDKATPEYYAAEYSFRYSIEAGSNLTATEGKTTTFATTMGASSSLFGDAVSAFEVYEAFAEMAKYADDAVVNSVIAQKP